MLKHKHRNNFIKYKWIKCPNQNRKKCAPQLYTIIRETL